MRKPRLIYNWRKVLRNAWSARLMLVAALLTGCEAVLPFVSDSFSRGTFAALTFFVIVGAFVSRFVVQQDLHDD